MFEDHKIIAAVREETAFPAALESPCEAVFLLSATIINIADRIAQAHGRNKKLFLHMDFADGIGKDEYGLRYLADLGIDGIISTRTGIIKSAKARGLVTVQRFFIVDSQSLKTALETIAATRPAMAELMPGVIPRAISFLKGKIDSPLIAGGLIESASDVRQALAAGAAAVSTGSAKLWAGA